MSASSATAQDRILFPSQVAKARPDWDWECCVAAADQYNMLKDKPARYLLVQQPIIAGFEEPSLPVEHNFADTLRPCQDGFAAAVAAYFVYMIMGGQSGSWLLSLFTGLMLVVGVRAAVSSRSSNPRVPYVDVESLGSGVLSRRAAYVLCTPGVEDHLDVSRSEMYTRIEFLKNYNRQRNQIGEAVAELCGTPYEDEAVQALRAHRDMFADCSRWLSDATVAASQVQIKKIKERRDLEARMSKEKAMLTLEAASHLPVSAELGMGAVAHQRYRVYQHLR